MNIFNAVNAIFEHKSVDEMLQLTSKILEFAKAPTLDPEVEIDRLNFFSQKDIVEIVTQTFADWADRDEPLGYATENWDVTPTNETIWDFQRIRQTTNPDCLPYDPREGF